LGNAPSAAHWRPSGHEHPQHLITALADLAQAGKTGASSPISFAEYAPEPNPETKKKDVVWLALKEDRPLFAFAG
jgi:putative SOS response-associated peptidase YedK